jgi:ribonuclease T2
MNSLTYFCFVLLLKTCLCDFDSYMFSQQWSPSICLALRNVATNEMSSLVDPSCKVAKDIDSWTIHGLWPKLKGTEKIYCNNNSKFSNETVKSILTPLKKYWPNLIDPKRYISFWTYEWKKHGTCSVPVLKGQFEYFNTSLQLQKKYNFLKFLKVKAITPNDDTYKYSEIMEALNLALHTSLTPPYCYIDVKQNKQYLAEIRICLDMKTLNPIPCTKEVSQYHQIRSSFPRAEMNPHFQHDPSSGSINEISMIQKSGLENKHKELKLSMCKKKFGVVYPSIKYN